jgi:hypothetical protein
LIDFLVILVVLALVVLLVSGPLRSRRAEEATESAERAELEAARDAKYREIRDAELDCARRRSRSCGDSTSSTLQPPARRRVPRCMRRTLTASEARAKHVMTDDRGGRGHGHGKPDHR